MRLSWCIRLGLIVLGGALFGSCGSGTGTPRDLDSSSSAKSTVEAYYRYVAGGEYSSARRLLADPHAEPRWIDEYESNLRKLSKLKVHDPIDLTSDKNAANDVPTNWRDRYDVLASVFVQFNIEYDSDAGVGELNGPVDRTLLLAHSRSDTRWIIISENNGA